MPAPCIDRRERAVPARQRAVARASPYAAQAKGWSSGRCAGRGRRQCCSSSEGAVTRGSSLATETAGFVEKQRFPLRSAARPQR